MYTALMQGDRTTRRRRLRRIIPGVADSAGARGYHIDRRGVERRCRSTGAARPGWARVRYVWVDTQSGEVYSVFRTIGMHRRQRVYLGRIPKGYCRVMLDSVEIAWPHLDGTVVAERCPRLRQSPFPSRELPVNAPPEASRRVVIAGWPMPCLYWAIASEPQRPLVDFGVGYWDNKKVPTRPAHHGLHRGLDRIRLALERLRSGSRSASRGGARLLATEVPRCRQPLPRLRLRQNRSAGGSPVARSAVDRRARCENSLEGESTRGRFSLSYQKVVSSRKRRIVIN